MKQTAVVVAPGRGTYNRGELGYFARHHMDKAAMLGEFDTYRESLGQKTLSELDGAARFSGPTHTRGDNASALIHACALADFQAINRDRFDIIGVTGNSMGWYIALTCAGALSPMDGLKVVNTMGTLMQQHLIGGQLIYPFVDDNWLPIPGERDRIVERMTEINARAGHTLALSIDLGGMLVLAGDEAGLSAFEKEMPLVQERFPMRLPNHAAFHTALQEPVAALGRNQLDQNLFRQPDLPLIDGRGGFWLPHASQHCGAARLYPRPSGGGPLRFHCRDPGCSARSDARCLHHPRTRHNTGRRSGAKPAAVRLARACLTRQTSSASRVRPRGSSLWDGKISANWRPEQVCQAAFLTGSAIFRQIGLAGSLCLDPGEKLGIFAIGFGATPMHQPVTQVGFGHLGKRAYQPPVQERVDNQRFAPQADTHSFDSGLNDHISLPESPGTGRNGQIHAGFPAPRTPSSGSPHQTVPHRPAKACAGTGH